MVRKWEESVKAFLTPGVLFEELGFRYFGPIDGHDFDRSSTRSGACAAMTGPRLVHVITQKGKGFPRANARGEKWHALPPGTIPRRASSCGCCRNAQYTKVFGEGLAVL
jgi:1-deoxy-D-xylulose-5-phosphate synthase